MAQITIEVPDEFAQRLEPFQSQLSELFTRFLSTNLPSGITEAEHTDEAYTPNHTHQEILDFLISQPTSQQIIDFKVSAQSQQQLQVLLQKNREGSLSAYEKDELNLYEQLDTLIGLLKVRAFSESQPKPMQV